MAISLSYNFEFLILPKFLAISDFNVCISLFEIVVQCMKEDVLIVVEFIRPATVSPMTITKEDDLVVIVKSYLTG